MVASRSIGRVALAVVGVLVVAATASGCGSAAVIPTGNGTAEQGQTVSFDLYTHCGIRDLSVDGKYFQRVGGSLSDGSGNPPKGWGNPYQHGTLSVSGDVAVFRDKVGHVETFQVPPGGTGLFGICS